MLTKIVYNCSPDSLGGVSEDQFTEAMENAVYSVPSFGELDFSVTFKLAVKSEITSWSSDDYDADADLENTFREQFDQIAEGAWNYCLKNPAA